MKEVRKNLMFDARTAVQVAGVPFEVSRLEDASQWLIDTARGPRTTGTAVRLANAYCVALSSTDEDYRALLNHPMGINFPDGLPVVAVMRAMTRSRTPRRVRGPSLFRKVIEDGQSTGLRHFFVGATPDVLEQLVNRIHTAYPKAIIAGCYSPAFAPVDDNYLAALTTMARSWPADVVWVGMGTPKQDFVAQALAEQCGFLTVGVGAAFAFLAGTVSEAPRWIQRSGFEWAFRLSREPRRLWQRYSFGNRRFVVLSAWQLLQHRRNPYVKSRRSD